MPATSSPRVRLDASHDAQEVGFEAAAASRADSSGTNDRVRGSRSTRAGWSYPSRSLRRCPLPADRAPGEPCGCSGNSRYRSWSAHARGRLDQSRIGMTTYLACGVEPGAEQAAAVRIGQPELDLADIDGRQRVEEVVDVEADLELVARNTRSRALPRPLPAPDCGTAGSARPSSLPGEYRGTSRSTGSLRAEERHAGCRDPQRSSSPGWPE